MADKKQPTANKKKKSLKILLIILCAIMFSLIIAATVLCITTEPIDTSLLNIKMTSSIYYTGEKGEKIILQNLYGDENRTWTNFDEIPLNMKNAFVAIEDERFYSHPGFDIKRLVGAGLNTVLRLFDKNRSVYGGSTITQQLVKNLTKEDDRSILRKFREIYRSIRLEMDMSKNDVLELYLNSIYLSQNCNGVGAAAKIYFDKDISDLNLAECASIAGITQYPSLYDPYLNPEANKEKQLTVLSKMLELDMITEEEYEEAASYKLNFRRSEEFASSHYSYFVDTVIEEVLDDLENKHNYSEAMAQNLLYTGGLQIKCTIDPEIQAILEEVYTNEANFIRNANDEVMQSAMVIVESSTGEVKGVVGGMGEKGGSRTYNRATALRQPGSSIKPIAVYAPAMDAGIIHSGSVLNDTNTTFQLDGGGTWTPKNAGGGFSGLVSLRVAIAKSLNIPAVQVLQDLGVENSYKFLEEKLGISSLVEYREIETGPTSDKALAPLALGGLTDGISPMEIAGAYTPFTNHGIFTEAHTYTEIYDYSGKLLYTKQPMRTNAIKDSTATLMTELLASVVSSGTGTAANFGGIDLAGKTGTTSNDYDKWFVGFTPSLVAATWVGYDTPERIIAYGNPAVNLWKTVMSQIDYTDYPDKFEDVLNFDDLERYTICTVSGRRASTFCTSIGTTYRAYMDEETLFNLGRCSSSLHKGTYSGKKSAISTGRTILDTTQEFIPDAGSIVIPPLDPSGVTVPEVPPVADIPPVTEVPPIADIPPVTEVPPVAEVPPVVEVPPVAATPPVTEDPPVEIPAA